MPLSDKMFGNFILFYFIFSLNTLDTWKDFMSLNFLGLSLHGFIDQTPKKAHTQYVVIL